MKDKSLKIIITHIIITITLLLYYFYIVGNFGDKYGFFSDNIIPQGSKSSIYSFMTIPSTIGYIIYFTKNIKRVLFLNWLLYPLSVLNIYVSIFYCVSISGGSSLWGILIPLSSIFIVLPISFFLGVSKDIKYYDNKK